MYNFVLDIISILTVEGTLCFNCLDFPRMPFIFTGTCYSVYPSTLVTPWTRKICPAKISTQALKKPTYSPTTRNRSHLVEQIQPLQFPIVHPSPLLQTFPNHRQNSRSELFAKTLSGHQEIHESSKFKVATPSFSTGSVRHCPRDIDLAEGSRNQLSTSTVVHPLYFLSLMGVRFAVQSSAISSLP